MLMKVISSKTNSYLQKLITIILKDELINVLKFESFNQ